MGKSKKTALRAARAAADAAYRAALGVPEGESLPATIGQAASAGSARGGKGRGHIPAAQSRRRRRVRTPRKDNGDV